MQSVAAQRPFFFDHIQAFADTCFDEFYELTGRRHQRVSTYRAEDADYLIVGQGSVIPSAEAVVDYLRETRGTKVGVVNMTMWRPFPGDLVGRIVKGKKGVAVLERLDQPLAVDLPMCKEIRAAVAKCVENGQSFGPLAGDRGVGTFGGSEDHTAILCSTAAHLGQFAYCPARFQRRIRLPADTTLAVGHCGIQAEKTGPAQELYNRASQQVSALVQTWQRATGRDEVYLADVLASGDGAADELRAHLASVPHETYAADELATRLDHFAAESDLIGPAGDALAAADLEEFGRLVDRSQQLSEDLLGNQIPETSGLARLARESGALAASAFGAGFGGSVWALVKARDAVDFLEVWSAAYKRDFAAGSDSRFFHTLPGPAAFEVSGW